MISNKILLSIALLALLSGHAAFASDQGQKPRVVT